MVRRGKLCSILVVLVVTQLLLGRAPVTRVFAVTEDGREDRNLPSDPSLLRNIQQATRRMDWDSIEAFMSSYPGNSNAVFGAALTAAIRCEKWQEGVKLYDKWKTRPHGGVKKNSVYMAALQIFGTLQDTDRVCEVYQDAVADCGLDKLLASARLTAAVQANDVLAASRVLDDMEALQVEIDLRHITSAIRSTWGLSSDRRHEVAQYFFQQLPLLRLQPDVAVFNSLLPAHRARSVQTVEGIYSDMRQLRVEPDTTFAHMFVTTLLQKPYGLAWRTKQEELQDILQKKSEDRLRAAHEALHHFEKSSGIELSPLCKGIKFALRQRFGSDDEIDPS